MGAMRIMNKMGKARKMGRKMACAVCEGKKDPVMSIMDMAKRD